MARKPCYHCGHLKGQHRDRLADQGADGRRTDRNTSCRLCACGEYEDRYEEPEDVTTV